MPTPLVPITAAPTAQQIAAQILQSANQLQALLTARYTWILVVGIVVQPTRQQ